MDPSVVGGIDGSLIAQEIFASVARMGRRLGASVVAVGVERDEEASCLREAGAALGQGFLFAAPMPRERSGERFEGGSAP